MAANHRYNSRDLYMENIPHPLLVNILTHNPSFEQQLTAVKERLEAAKQGSTRGLGGGAPGPFSFGGGGRVAKPLRGGQGGGEAPIPTIQGLQEANAPPAQNKRTSWFFSQK